MVHKLRNLKNNPNRSLDVLNKIEHSSLHKKISKPKTIHDYEIFAYCSKNYKDAFDFVVPSWSRWDNVTKITVFTDWDFEYNDPKVEIRKIFDPSSDWIVGTGRRLDTIYKYSNENKGQDKNFLFLDIDCYITEDVSHVFDEDFDLAITRLKSTERYANKTATAGLWFARFTDGYYKFIKEWFSLAKKYKFLGKGLTPHYISYVQYSFTDVAKRQTDDYNILALNEKIYNSEHSSIKEWLKNIELYHPRILHYKGRRFRNKNLVNKTLQLCGDTLNG